MTEPRRVSSLKHSSRELSTFRLQARQRGTPLRRIFAVFRRISRRATLHGRRSRPPAKRSRHKTRERTVISGWLTTDSTKHWIDWNVWLKCILNKNKPQFFGAMARPRRVAGKVGPGIATQPHHSTETSQHICKANGGDEANGSATVLVHPRRNNQ